MSAGFVCISGVVLLVFLLALYFSRNEIIPTIVSEGKITREICQCAYMICLLVSVLAMLSPTVLTEFGTTKTTIDMNELVKLDGNYVVNKTKYNTQYVHVMGDGDTVKDIMLPSEITEIYKVEGTDIPRIEYVTDTTSLLFLKQENTVYRVYLPE